MMFLQSSIITLFTQELGRRFCDFLESYGCKKDVESTLYTYLVQRDLASRRISSITLKALALNRKSLKKVFENYKLSSDIFI